MYFQDVMNYNDMTSKIIMMGRAYVQYESPGVGRSMSLAGEWEDGLYLCWQVSEGLAFLHNSVKIVHRNICPENIVLNHQGAWKLFGFDFCVANQAPPDQQVIFVNLIYRGRERSRVKIREEKCLP